MEHYLDKIHIFVFILCFVLGWIIGWCIAKSKQLKQNPHLTPEERELYNYFKLNYNQIKQQIQDIEEKIGDRKY